MTLREMRRKARAHERQRGWPRVRENIDGTIDGSPEHPMIDWRFKLRRTASAALAAFKAGNPWRQDDDGFLALVRQLYTDLADAYDMPAPTVDHEGPWEGGTGDSNYDTTAHAVTLAGRASVLTALHEFAHARGYDETGAVWWSVNVFRLTWPASWARLRPSRRTPYMLVRGPARSVADATRWWRRFYENRPPEGATESEARLWVRLGPEARRAVRERARQRVRRERRQDDRIEADDEDGDGPSRLALVALEVFGDVTREPEGWTPADKPDDSGVERFRNLDLS